MLAPETGATLARSSIPVPAVSPSNNRSTPNTGFFLGEQIMAEPGLCVNKKLCPHRETPPTAPTSPRKQTHPLLAAGRIRACIHLPFPGPATARRTKCDRPPFSWDTRELRPPQEGTAAGGTEQGGGLGDPARPRPQQSLS